MATLGGVSLSIMKMVAEGERGGPACSSSGSSSRELLMQME